MPKARVIAPRFPTITDRGRRTHLRGDVVELSDAVYDRGIRLGALEPAGGKGKLPKANVAAGKAKAVAAPTSHKEADKQAKTLSLKFPAKTTLAAKKAAIAEIRAATAQG